MKDIIITIGLDFGPGELTSDQHMLQLIFNNMNITNRASVNRMKKLINEFPEMRAFEDKLFNQILDKAAEAYPCLFIPWEDYDSKLMEVVVYFFTQKMLATFLESYDYFCEDMAKLEKAAKENKRSAEFFKHSVLEQIRDFVKSTPEERQRKEVQKRNKDIRKRNAEITKRNAEIERLGRNEELEEEEEEIEE